MLVALAPLHQQFGFLGSAMLGTGSPAKTRARELGEMCDVSCLPTDSLLGRTEGKYDLGPSKPMAEW